jgi:hypothetical protein
VKKLSATDAINLYEKSLSALPGIRSLHVGFDEDRPVIIVTADEITDALEDNIEAIAPNAPIKIIQVGTKKADTGSDTANPSGKPGASGRRKIISPSEAKDRYGKKIRALKTVTSVNVGKKSGQDVLVVRAFPLTESTKLAVRAIAPNAQLEFKESPYSKTSASSIFSFIINKLKFLIILLAVGEILFVLLSPLYYATDDIEFAIAASSADGVVVTAERPMANPNNRDDISQEVTIKFSAKIGTVLFTQQTALFKTLSLDNMNAEPYHKGETVAVAFNSSDPQNTARIFDRSRFWATIILYTAALIFMFQIALRARKHWQEW